MGDNKYLQYDLRETDKVQERLAALTSGSDEDPCPGDLGFSRHYNGGILVNRLEWDVYGSIGMTECLQNQPSDRQSDRWNKQNRRYKNEPIVCTFLHTSTSRSG